MPRVKPGELPAKQKLFMEHYLGDADRSGTKAAIAAGYAPSGAKVRACEILARPEAQEMIRQHSEAIMAKAQLTQQEACCILARIARARLGDVLGEDGEIDVDKVKAAQQELQEYSREDLANGGTNRKIKMRDPIAAIALLSKLAGWIGPASMHIGDTNTNVNIVIVEHK